MPTIITGRKEREASHSRHLASRGAQAPNRSSLAAALAVAVVVAELLFAQLTLAVTICLAILGWLTRWRPLWLACPAVAGLTWALAIGLHQAADGYLAMAGHVLRVVAGSGPAGAPGQLGLAGLWESGLAGAAHLVSRQLPVALVAGAGQALLLRPAGSRPGLLAAARRAYVAGTLRRGEVATVDGCCVGVIPGSGRRLTVAWARAAGGMLCTGRDSADVSATSWELAWAAIQHRKSVIIVDLAGSVGGGGRGGQGRAVSSGLDEMITAACVAAGAPLRCLGGARVQRDGRGPHRYAAGSRAGRPHRQADGHSGLLCGYDPVAGLRPEQAVRLVSAIIDWSPVAEARRAFCADYLTTALELVRLAGQRRPAGSGRPGLGELAGLLGPGGLEGGVRRAGLGAGHPLGRRVSELVSLREADPRPLALVAAQLAQFARSPAGQCLGQPGPGISLRQALADREVVLFSPGRGAPGGHSAMLGRLVIADLIEALTERAEAGAAADCLVWVSGCEAIGPRQLGGLVAAGSRAGTCVLLSTASDGCASRLASEAGVLILRGEPPPGLAASLTAGLDDEPGVADPAAVSVGVPETGGRPGSGASWQFETGRAVR